VTTQGESRRRRRRAPRSAESQEVRLDPGRLKDLKWRDYVVRFVFGAAIAALAATLGVVVNHRFGGLFLAFPAILPAGLTLIEKKEDNMEAEVDVIGAVMGAIGMVGFAVTAALTLDRWPLPLSLLAATAAWAAIAGGLFTIANTVMTRMNLAPSPPGQPRRRR
jgi:uncharacterized membrane protein